ncbi:STAS domain-containing protein [Streptomyces sp. ODS28]|uniref:STAS domain-containing protein n=1 Tax=Streptomyces sp. ODS28 TaxID=3136688 RepID=UPI0031EE13CB
MTIQPAACCGHPHGTLRRWKGRCLVTVPGELDLHAALSLTPHCLDPATTGRGCAAMVDMRWVTFRDLAGLAALRRAHRRALERGGHLVLVTQQPGLLRRLAFTGAPIPYATSLVRARAACPAVPPPARSRG